MYKRYFPYETVDDIENLLRQSYESIKEFNEDIKARILTLF